MSDPSRQILQIDMRQIHQIAAELRAAAPQIINEAWKTLSAWGEEYRRRVVRVMPVETGHARQSWVLIRDKSGDEMSVTIGNTIKSTGHGRAYPVYLEFGTARIAGGRVLRWQPGQAAIMDWPAKMENITDLRQFSNDGRTRNALGHFLSGGRSTGTRAFERAVTIATKAFTAGQGEQMPILRPIGYEIAPQIAEDVLHAMRNGFDSFRRRNGGS